MGNAEGTSGAGCNATSCKAICLGPDGARRPCGARPCEHQRASTGHHAEGTESADPGLIQIIGRCRLKSGVIFEGGLRAERATAPRRLGSAPRARPCGGRRIGSKCATGGPNPRSCHRTRQAAPTTYKVASRLRLKRKLQFFPIVNATRSSRGVQMRPRPRGPWRRSSRQMAKGRRKRSHFYLMAGS